MSNQIQLIRTEFIALRTGDRNYGYRIFDDYDMGYGMFADNNRPPDDDIDFLREARCGATDAVAGLLDAARENGINIDGTFLTADEVLIAFRNKEP